MKKRTPKLSLTRETLHRLEEPSLRRAAAGLRATQTSDDNPSYQSGETWCWCSKSCETVPWTGGSAVDN